MNSENVLQTVGLSKTFGAVVAADDISVDVRKGARLSLIGANGAGKTTFMNLVTGYQKPDSGEILLAGEQITRLNPRQITRRGVCRSFQIPQLYEPMTAIENLLVALAASGQHYSMFGRAREPAHIEEARHLLARFSLDDYAQRTVSELPGGIRKLLDIAMAMVRKPDVLLLDEPTSGVSAEEKFPLMDTVMEALSHGDVTVLFVEHDMDIVVRYSDRVLAFYSGQIIADDQPDEVLSNIEVQKYVTGTAR